MHLRLARDPQHLTAPNPIIIEEFLVFEAAGKQEGVAMHIKMLADLHEKGRDSRYLEKMKSLPIWELKSASRGGEKGGARVYLFMIGSGELEPDAGIVNCEIKEADAPDGGKLETVLEVLDAFQRGVRVFRGGK